MKFLLAVATAVAIVLASTSYFSAASASLDKSEMRDATVFVFVEREGKYMGHGSGVLTEHGVITAAHVIDNAMKDDRIVVQFHGGEYVHATVERSEWEMGKASIDTDLALLSIPTDSGYPRAELRCGKANLDEPVYVVGHPGKVRWSLTQGTVISEVPRPGWKPGRWLQTDATIAGGNSGGPMFDSKGRVIGIVSHAQVGGGMGSRAPTGHGFGQTGPVVCGFLGLAG